MRKIGIFLRGILMGICDIIPGISGGTIAFITGIYARLINAVKAISPKIIIDLFKDKKEFEKDIKKIDIGFLLILVLGIGTSIMLGSRIIKFLLDNYFAYTLAFFIGLIIASSKIIYKEIDNKKTKNKIFGILGILGGVLLSFLIPLEILNPNLSYLFFGGFFAISAMFLPGISGAFILLIMGLYDFIINALHHPLNYLDYIGIFVVGAAIGAFIISRVISFLFKKDKSKTLYFLLGLVIGGLSTPVRRILQKNPGFLDCFIMVICFILGILLVKIVKDYAKKIKI